MATRDQRLQEQQQQRDNVKLRTALNNAYGAIEGRKYTDTVVAFTFEEAVDAQIERLSATDRLRPNDFDRTDRIEAELLQAVDNIKKVPPEAFMQTNSVRDVNTDVEG